jgi:hypothetical protein
MENGRASTTLSAGDLPRATALVEREGVDAVGAAPDRHDRRAQRDLAPQAISGAGSVSPATAARTPSTSCFGRALLSKKPLPSGACAAAFASFAPGAAVGLAAEGVRWVVAR